MYPGISASLATNKWPSCCLLLRRSVIIASSRRAVRPYLSTVILTRTSNRSNFQLPTSNFQVLVVGSGAVDRGSWAREVGPKEGKGFRFPKRHTLPFSDASRAPVSPSRVYQREIGTSMPAWHPQFGCTASLGAPFAGWSPADRKRVSGRTCLEVATK